MRGFGFARFKLERPFEIVILYIDSAVSPDRPVVAFKPLTANKDGLVQQGIWKSRYDDAMRENIGYIKSVHEKFKKEKTR